MFRFVWTPRNMWLEAIDHRYPSGTQVIHLRPLASTPVRISDNRLHDWPIVVGAIGVTLRYQLANRGRDVVSDCRRVFASILRARNRRILIKCELEFSDLAVSLIVNPPTSRNTTIWRNFEGSW